MKLKTELSALALASAAVLGVAGQAGAWSLEEAAKPYAGTELEVLFLDRPGYKAAIQMIPEFEAATGIKINQTTVPWCSVIVRNCYGVGGLGHQRHSAGGGGPLHRPLRVREVHDSCGTRRASQG